MFALIVHRILFRHALDRRLPPALELSRLGRMPSRQPELRSAVLRASHARPCRYLILTTEREDYTISESRRQGSCR